MAETNTSKSQGEKEREQTLAAQQESRGIRRRDPAFGTFVNPFEFMDRMTEEMDRWFERMTREMELPRRGGWSRGLFGSSAREGVWLPRIEAGQKGDTFLVRADLPGLNKDDVEVELTEDAIIIHGERRAEQREEREGYWRSEREYGQFHRAIPLPDGVIAESAEATFRDGVLEVSLKAAPSEANRGRKLEIKDASSGDRNA